MGLDTSHDCWHGAYSEFMRYRTTLAALVGINLESMRGFGGSQEWPSADAEPLVHLLNHSDCDGVIEWQHCAALANRLEALLPLLPKEPDGGHIGDWRECTQKWIDGLRDADRCREDVEFH